MPPAYDRAAALLWGPSMHMGSSATPAPKAGLSELLTPDYMIVQKSALASGPEHPVAPAERFPAGSQPAAKALPSPRGRGAGRADARPIVEAWRMHRPLRLPFCINRSHRGAILALPTAQPLWSPCPSFSLHAGFLICSTCWSYFHSAFLDLN